MRITKTMWAQLREKERRLVARAQALVPTVKHQPAQAKPKVRVKAGSRPHQPEGSAS